ncbi:MAG: hypothetical protein OEM05_15915 [Myxococcales bacterium]|nr:hypothetical protein [Myxococcales bacterium]
MSLRAFHLVFVLLAIVTAEMFGARQLWHYHLTADLAQLWMGVLSLAGGLGLSVYALFFVRKMDSADIR